MTEDRPLSRLWFSDLWAERTISLRGVRCLFCVPRNAWQWTFWAATDSTECCEWDFSYIQLEAHVPWEYYEKAFSCTRGSFMGFCLFLKLHSCCVSQACDDPADDPPPPPRSLINPSGSWLCKGYFTPIVSDFIVRICLSPVPTNDNSDTANLGSHGVRCFWFKITAPTNRVVQSGHTWIWPYRNSQVSSNWEVVRKMIGKGSPPPECQHHGLQGGIKEE